MGKLWGDWVPNLVVTPLILESRKFNLGIGGRFVMLVSNSLPKPGPSLALCGNTCPEFETLIPRVQELGIVIRNSLEMLDANLIPKNQTCKYTLGELRS